MCSLWNNLQPVEGVQYLVEVEESKFCFIHFTILTFKTGVINILVLAGIEHLLDFPSLLEVSKFQSYHQATMIRLTGLVNSSEECTVLVYFP